MSFDRVVELAVQADGIEAVNLTGLRIRFNGLKTSLQTPNQIEIEVFNVSQETVNKIAVEGNTVILKAGYRDEGGAKTILRGNITKSFYYHEGTETRLELTCSDGQKEYGTTPVSLSYKAGTAPETIVRDLLATIPLAVARQTTIAPASYATGYSFVGSAFDALEEVLNRVGLTFSIQNNELYILAQGETVEATAFLISPSTGLIDSPIPMVKVDNTATEAVKAKQYRVKCLLNPVLLPSSYIQLESRTANGFFKILVIRQKGDSRQGDFQSEMEVEEV